MFPVLPARNTGAYANTACVGSVNKQTQPYATHANGHLHIYFFKEYRTSMLLKKQLYLFILFSFLLLSNCVDFLPSLDFIWAFESTPWNTRTIYSETLFLCFCFCSFFVNSRRHFSFSTKASALAFSISLKKAFSLASMSAFDFCYLESLFSSLKNLKLLQEISPGQLHQNHACW